MAKIEIYSTATCSYCERAKQLLKHKGADYIEIRIDQDPAKRDEMLARAEGRRTVPQIFINDQGIGGFDDLWKLEQQGKLDQLINTNNS